MNTNRPRIAICFFGIPRSLEKTANSITENVIEPAAAIGDVTLLAHFFEQKKISNPRSGEIQVQLQKNNQHLPFDKIIATPPDTKEIQQLIQDSATYGDAWGDDFGSLRNLIHQLHSLKKAYALATEKHADIFAFIRPDLNYHDSLYSVFEEAQSLHRSGASRIFTPDWQRWGGANDRFAIAVGKKAADAYGYRVESARRFCEEFGRPLHSERLLAFSLKLHGVQISHIRHRASRVRANDIQSWEDFNPNWSKKIQEQLKVQVRPKSKILYKVALLMSTTAFRILFASRYRNIDPPNGVYQRSKKDEKAMRRKKTSQ